jgi:hypothetical protein
LHNGESTKKVRKKVRKKFEKMFEKKFENITNCRRGGEGRGGREGEELSFQCLRPSTSKLMAAGKNKQTIFRD